MSDKLLITSYVDYDDKTFMVNTFDRDSSAMLGPRRYAETIVWDYDSKTHEKKSIISQHSGSEGTIFTHLQVCQFLHDTGRSEAESEDL